MLKLLAKQINNNKRLNREGEREREMEGERGSHSPARPGIEPKVLLILGRMGDFAVKLLKCKQGRKSFLLTGVATVAGGGVGKWEPGVVVARCLCQYSLCPRCDYVCAAILIGNVIK